MTDATHPTTATTDALRQRMREHYLTDESEAVRQLLSTSTLSPDDRASIGRQAEALINAVRDHSEPGVLESFLEQYGLSTSEGVALMCLAEALLRVPDSTTIDALIHDKIVPADWGRHLGQSSSSMVNASTWALMLTGKMISDENEGLVGTLHGAIKRLGEPVIRTAVSQSIKEMGNQFVLGESIKEAITHSEPAIKRGYTYSYDMLGEAAKTEADAKRYHLAYSTAVSLLSASCQSQAVRENPGISVKLSALYPRYEFAQRERVMEHLVARTRSLAMLAKSASMGFNIDAEEADRLDLSLDVIEAVLSDPSLNDWDGFGIVVQAYSPRAPFVLDWLYDLSQRLDRRLMVRLVKGAYWDTEIKQAQVEGLEAFPVFTRKANTDISYIVCAEKLLGMTDRIYPQFATHNAHTVAAILHMAKDRDNFEFQRLHGMGDSLHDEILKREKTRCRIYAPVGAHQDLLAYLVRRLLENGANSSFVNQIVDESIPADVIAKDPFPSEPVTRDTDFSHPAIKSAAALYGDSRRNSAGFDLSDPLVMSALEEQRAAFSNTQWYAKPTTGQPGDAANETQAERITVRNPANHADVVGHVTHTTSAQIHRAFEQASEAQPAWSKLAATERGNLLRKTADLYEQHTAELMALAAREAGKTHLDALSELREAVDFLRYYAAQAEQVDATLATARGNYVCISPWNFPLAIFTGQIAAALATGNAVLAKPSEQTPLIAYRAVELMYEAGIPPTILHLLPGTGVETGATLVSDLRTSGVCFTGSTATAQTINRTLASVGNADAPLIAETGGLNAMIVDSTALPEQAITDILASAFQSAGQRCSALRVLYLQEDIKEKFLTMLRGATQLLSIDDPWKLSTDIGPVIDRTAQQTITAHCDKLAAEGREMLKIELPEHCQSGTYVAPAIYALNSIDELESEIFGPVLHVITFKANEFERLLAAINNTGYGLTFGLHSRVDERVQDVVDGIHAGNIYVNRNQIGAVVESQPFGGRGLSGTGPKAGGPHYLLRFLQSANHTAKTATAPDTGKALTLSTLNDALKAGRATGDTPVDIEQALHTQRTDDELMLLAQHCAQRHYHATLDLPGPTGESNRLSMKPAGCVLCLDQGDSDRFLAQACQAAMLGNHVVAVTTNTDAATVLSSFTDVSLTVLDGAVSNDLLLQATPLDAVRSSGDGTTLVALRQALSAREGAIVPLSTDLYDISPLIDEATLCIDTTAAGGNASLLAMGAADHG